ncbi:MAG: pyridoxamine 5'-phosphate oxidase family protein [Sinobacterium sp.]|nr:pyridoxamine 5'-phosphate oxidase family protein [Sinobacterium sp.]
MFDDFSLKLFKAQNECTLSWITQDGGPAATVVSFIYHDNCIWMTAMTHQARVRAIKRNAKVAVVVSGKGSKLGDTRCVSMRGSCEILSDEASRDWFFPLFSKKVLNNRLGAKMMSKTMNNADNIVLKFHPEKIIPYDAQKMMKMAKFMP